MYECVLLGCVGCQVSRWGVYFALGPWDKVNLGDKSPTVFLVLIYKFVLIKSREKKLLPLFSYKTDTRTDSRTERQTERQWDKLEDCRLKEFQCP